MAQNVIINGVTYQSVPEVDIPNGKVTLYCFSSNARGLLTNGRTYSYTFVKYTS